MMRGLMALTCAAPRPSLSSAPGRYASSTTSDTRASLSRIWRFDLDHVGAHVGEQRAGKRAGDEIRQLDDPNSRQRFWHVDFLALGLSGGGPTHFSVVHQTRTRFSYCIFSPALSMMSLYIGTSRAMRARKTSGPSATTGRPAFTNFSRISG